MKSGRIYINLTFNNTIITLTDLSGKVLLCSSAGLYGFKGARKKTPYALQTTLLKLLDQIHKFNILYLQLFIKRGDQQIDSLLQFFRSYNFIILRIKDISPISFNGCRLAKIRKI